MNYPPQLSSHSPILFADNASILYIISKLISFKTALIRKCAKKNSLHLLLMIKHILDYT